MAKVSIGRTVSAASRLTPDQLRDIPRTYSVNTLGVPYVWPNGYVTADARRDGSPVDPVTEVPMATESAPALRDGYRPTRE